MKKTFCDVSLKKQYLMCRLLYKISLYIITKRSSSHSDKAVISLIYSRSPSYNRKPYSSV